MIGSMLVLSVLAAPITLQEVRLASRQNLEALRAQLELERADTQRTTARSAILPQLGLNLQAGANVRGPQRQFGVFPVLDANGAVTGFEQGLREVSGGSSGNFQLSLTLTQLLYDGGRWWNQIAAAGFQEEAARGRLQEQQLASELEAVRRFFELLRAQYQLQVLEASVERSLRQVERSKAVYEAGRGSKRDAIDAQVNLGNDRIAVERQRQAIATAQADLLQWLGRSWSPVEAVPDGETTQSAASRAAPERFEALLERARSQRPLLRQLERTLAAANASTAVAWADYLPSISAQLAYVRTSPVAETFFTPRLQNAANFGVGLQWNLFSGFATQAQVARGRLDASAATLSLEQADRDIQADLQRAHATLAASLKVLGLAEANRELAAQNMSLAEERFTAGAGTTLEVRDASNKDALAMLELLRSRIDVEIAQAALRRVVGPAPDAQEKP